MVCRKSSFSAVLISGTGGLGMMGCPESSRSTATGGGRGSKTGSMGLEAGSPHLEMAFSKISDRISVY